MPLQITARLPDPVVEALDKAATQLGRSRAEVTRLAVERYLEDFDDLYLRHRPASRAQRSGAGLGPDPA